MSSQLHTERRDRTLILTISDPASRNSLSEQVFAAGIEALGVAESDPEIRAIILQGDGAHFSAGGNIARLERHREAPPQVQGQVLQHFHEFVEAIRVCPKPVIAAVEGAAAGGGFSLALACDLIVAAADARCVLSYGAIGLSPDGGVTWHLMQRVPRAQVLQWLWLAEPIPIEQLHAAGIVNWVSGSGQALAQALSVAARLAEGAPNAIASAKELVNQWPHATLGEQAALEGTQFLANLYHPNTAEGLAAFTGKRPPLFR